ERPGVEGVEGTTLPVEDVVGRIPRRRRVVGFAELFRIDVADVVSCGGQAPRVVRRASDEDVHREAGDGRALRVDAGSVEIDLLHDLRVEVAELRTHHRDRVAGRRARRCDDQEVRRAPTGGG